MAKLRIVFREYLLNRLLEKKYKNRPHFYAYIHYLVKFENILGNNCSTNCEFFKTIEFLTILWAKTHFFGQFLSSINFINAKSFEFQILAVPSGSEDKLIY